MTSTLPASGRSGDDELARFGGRGQERFDRVVALAKELFGVPVAAVNIVGDELVIPLAAAGADLEPMPREVAFCSTAVDGVGQLLVTDAEHDQRFKSNPLVTDDPHLRFYAGQPLTTSGERVGTHAERAQFPPARAAGRGQVLDGVRGVGVARGLAGRDHQRAGGVQAVAARHTISQMRSIVASSSSGKIGSEKQRSAYSSATGQAGSAASCARIAFWRCSGMG